MMASIATIFNIYKKTNPTQKQLFKDSVLHITKGYCPLSSIENI
jgi:hypothetical protein